MPVKRPKRVGRTRNRPMLERIDPRFEPPEHLAFRSFVTLNPLERGLISAQRPYVARRGEAKPRELCRQVRKVAAFLQWNWAASGHRDSSRAPTRGARARGQCFPARAATPRGGLG